MPLNLSERVKRSSVEKIFRVRMTNLREQVKVYGNQSRLARALGVTPQYINAVIGMNPTRIIGEKFARDAEVSLGLPKGHLDVMR